MFDRFTDRARKVMGLAYQEAQRFHHDYIGTEHVLLGLVQEGSGVAASVLQNLDVDLAKVRREVERLVSTGTTVAAVGQLPFTPRAKKVLELSLEEASNLGHTYIGTEHLLLGLVRESEGIAAQVLRNLEVKVEDVREEVLDLLGGDADADGDEEDAIAGGPRSDVSRRAGPSASAASPPPLVRLTKAALRALDDARREAEALGAAEVSADHLAFALASGTDSLAARLWLDRHADVAGLRAALPAADPDARRAERPLGLGVEARGAVESAGRIAEERGHESTTTGHLLLALLLRPGGAPALLRALRPPEEDLVGERQERDAVCAEIGARIEADPDDLGARPVPRAPEVDRALDAAIRLAAERGHDAVHADHLFLGVWRMSPALGAALRDLGIDVARHAARVERRLDDSRAPAAPEPPGLSGEARRILGRAGAAARRFGADRVAAEHLLWALVEDDGDADDRFGEGRGDEGRAAVLARCGLDAPARAAEIERTLRRRRGSGRVASLASPPTGSPLFSAQAADALRDAVALAWRHGGRVEPDHVFFGVVRAAQRHPDFAARVDPAVDLTRFSADEAATLAPHGDPAREAAFSSTALALLSIAFACAASRGSEVVAVDDLLLALVSSEDGAVPELLRGAGTSAAAVADVLRASRRPPPPPPAPPLP